MRKRIAFIMVTVCVLLITGCGASNSAEDSTGTDNQMVENAGQTDTEENISTDGAADYPAVLEGDPMPAEVDESRKLSGSDQDEIFKVVLLGDSPFFYCSGGNAETMVITDVKVLFDENDSYMKVWDFSVVDLNGDGEDEVILFVVGVAGDMGGKVILHQIGDEVYGYTTDNRTLVDLKIDGTYGYSDPTGVAEAGIATVSDFSETEYTVDKITYATGTYKGWDTFVADHQTVTEEEYLDTVYLQDQKQNAEWYEFTDENINTLF